MQYTYSNTLGEEITFQDIQKLKNILERPYDYWLEGTGETAIHINDNERMIFFKIKEGVFIMQHPDYLAPKTNHREVIMYTHYVGGQEMYVPSTCISNETQAFDILCHYIQNGKLPDEFLWIDFFEEK